MRKREFYLERSIAIFILQTITAIVIKEKAIDKIVEKENEKMKTTYE